MLGDDSLGSPNKHHNGMMLLGGPTTTTGASTNGPSGRDANLNHYKLNQVSLKNKSFILINII